MDLTLAHPTVRAGREVLVHATPIESVTRGQRSSLVRIRADVRRAIVVLAGERTALSPDLIGHGWSARIPVPSNLPPGRYELQLLVTDMAMNVHRAYATVLVR
jgi:hypothetical protein